MMNVLLCLFIYSLSTFPLFFHSVNAGSATSLRGLTPQDLSCLQREQLFYNGTCYPPLSSKPCSPSGQSWLVLASDNADFISSQCISRGDASPSIQSCSHPQFDVFGHFKCDCKGQKSQFKMYRKGSRACSGSPAPPPCPIELRESLKGTCSDYRDFCCVPAKERNIGVCQHGAELSSFYYNLTGSFFHDYHDFYEKAGGFGDYFSESKSSLDSSDSADSSDFFSNFDDPSHYHSPSSSGSRFKDETARDGGSDGVVEDEEGIKRCPDGTTIPADCPLNVCCPQNEIGMDDMEMDFCEKNGYVWNKGLRECIPKLFFWGQRYVCWTI
ncbi:unnamed protein product [Lepeophtheirus salmonis]|uniref:(salmon louse) hypothetical protein n=1 Tax=Lepeophtheirus salmonis TaxID=72036 RepID=A0A7R8CCS3_LEPSM|nr:unnamed protein product [Lepeophtheirus salmonis]CAF2772014.1 unnamed protein product [Lepeophtheirus salmonis]